MAAAALDIPAHLLADPIAPEIVWEKGSLGSPVLVLKGGHPEVLKAMTAAYGKRFRKGWRDLAQGLAVFMAPSMSHETTAFEVGDLVRAICASKKLAAVSLKSTTLRLQNGGAEPDESFFIGEKAQRYSKLRRQQGVSAANNAFDGIPADLVVEVEHTHYDETKRGIYRNAGVTEMWEMTTHTESDQHVIVNLQAPGNPQPSAASSVVPGVRSDGLEEALHVLREIGGGFAFANALGQGLPVALRLLKAAAGKSE